MIKNRSVTFNVPTSITDKFNNIPEKFKSISEKNIAYGLIVLSFLAFLFSIILYTTQYSSQLNETQYFALNQIATFTTNGLLPDPGNLILPFLQTNFILQNNSQQEMLKMKLFDNISVKSNDPNNDPGFQITYTLNKDTVLFQVEGNGQTWDVKMGDSDQLKSSIDLPSST